MLTIAAIPIVCWMAVLIAKPRRPRPGCEVAHSVYTHLLGRQQRLVALALATTALACFAHVVGLPPSVASPREAPTAQEVCYDGGSVSLTCYTPQPGGMWLRRELQANGTWRVTGASLAAPCAVACRSRERT